MKSCTSTLTYPFMVAEGRLYILFTTWPGKSSTTLKYLLGILPVHNSLKYRDFLLPLLFNLDLEYVISKVHVNMKELKLNGTHQFLVYADGDVDLLGKNINTIKTQKLY
jgi:hypothetical protein